ncbi:hypothetical protein CRENBAI_005815 [Crenichthys baileyi]|uniref:Uncharacterized protein n=1 Tax=Crenichthys baileyi TaxID=28760 RepID=A0AAV9QSB3_9TELE
MEAGTASHTFLCTDSGSESYPAASRLLKEPNVPFSRNKTHYDSTTPPQGPSRRREADHSVGVSPASRTEVLRPAGTSLGAAVAIPGDQTGGASPRDRPVTLRVSACLLRQPQAASEA